MTDVPRCDLAVIGGGPAGFFGALRYAAMQPDRQVIVLEKSERVLQKVLISGGGRCNITHACDDPRELIQSYPRGGKALLSAFYSFGPADTLQWFRQRGLEFYTDETGCVFPVTDDAQSVMDVLLKEAQQVGLRVWTEAGVESIQRDESGGFLLSLSNGQSLAAQQILVATGGNRATLRMLKQLGIPVVEPVPALFPFRLDEAWLADYAGQVVEGCRVSIPETEHQAWGAVLITHRGISGPGVIRLSSWAARYLKERHYTATIQVDWLAGEGTAEQTIQALKELRTTWAGRQVVQQSPFPVLSNRLWRGFCGRLPEIMEKRWGDVSNQALNQFGKMLHGMPLTVIGRDQHRQEYVTCGGVDLKALQLRTLESTEIPKLFFAGEVLDIDGLTGGYNLQNCWTTGWLAGSSLAENAV